MGIPTTPLPVKLFIGMLAADPGLFDQCAVLLAGHYGPVESESPVWGWYASDYYREEMGAVLFRKFISFQRLVDPDVLPSVKLRTNSMEASLAVPGEPPGRRRINLDPGYVTEAKVVLASTKDYSHRISIGSGMYAEVTLHYSKKDQGFVASGHTYPDYRSDEVRAWFCAVRNHLRTALRGRTR